jgi:hypothetical protein
VKPRRPIYVVLEYNFWLLSHDKRDKDNIDRGDKSKYDKKIELCLIVMYNIK